MNYRKINLYLGWFVFLISTIVYLITIEDTVSLWDCGEYITAAYKLEVGHPPGAPLYMLLGRLFSFFAAEENVAVWINRLSALSSSGTILFMFWSLTMLVKKIAMVGKETLTKGDKIAIFGSAFIGSLAYTFSDSFWFSAVEGEVYAMSSLFTAVIFWAILKWDEEMAAVQANKLQLAGYSPDRWVLLIMFLLGLAIGVHLLGILVVPAIAYVMYFRYYDTVDLKGILIVGVLSVFVLGFIQEGVIPGTIAIASKFEVSFVNSMGLPFYSGTIFFFILIVALCIYLIRYARKKGNRIVYTATMGLILLLIGYGSFAVIVIRSNANTPLDENDPENLVTLHAYLKREQYGSAPLMTGPFWNSKLNPREKWKDAPAIHLRRHVVVKNGEDIKAFKDEKRAVEYSKQVKGSEVVEKYFVSNAGSKREKSQPTYEQTTFFPRMYWSAEARRTEGYKKWSGYNAAEDKGTDIGDDGKRLPTFGENLTYFWRYQVNWMYWRYFMWNFAGRQNDIQGNGDAMRGNWISGIDMIDTSRLGNQNEYAPYFTKDNPAHNKYFLLPLILGVIGLIYHIKKAPKDAFVIFLAFLFTGVAIVVYLNQKPFEPRERDYAFAGSFYFFALWLGIGVYALYDAFKSFGKNEFKWIGIIGLAMLFATLLNSSSAALSWLVILGVSAAVIGLMVLARKFIKSDTGGAVLASALCLIVPVIMGVQGWDDHDRSLKTTAHDLALNYLNSCAPNGIIFTNGDNDTFPLWYMQEVEGQRTDVRVCNLSLMQTDWYTEQMMMKAYKSEPLPIKFTEDQILMNSGYTDQVLLSDLFELMYMGVDNTTIKNIVALRLKNNVDKMKVSAQTIIENGPSLLSAMTLQSPRLNTQFEQIKQMIAAPTTTDPVKDAMLKLQAGVQLIKYAQDGLVRGDNKVMQSFQNMIMQFESSWNSTNLVEAMEFVRNDDNIVTFKDGRRYRTFPSNTFTMVVNRDNVKNSKLFNEDLMKYCMAQIEFKIDKNAITKEQVMMLDIIANNDWERPLYFSSPYGSDVAIGLMRGGYIRQNGIAYELSPLSMKAGRVNVDHMYANLMENYDFGAMNNPTVLTDYYARRHTSQYRRQFYDLAQEYLRMALTAEDEIKRAEMMRELQPEAVIQEPSATPEQIKEYKEKAINLIKRSLDKMPPEIVIDYGEPNVNPSRGAEYAWNGSTLPAYTDGILHEYVYILYLAGDKKGAEELGMKVADQLESIISYYDHSPADIAARPENTDDLYAAIDNYFQIHMAAIDPEKGDQDSKLSQRTSKFIQHIYEDMYPKIFNELKDLASENGESTRRSSNPGYYGSMLFQMQDYSEAMALKYGLIDEPTVQPQQPQNQQGAPGLPMP